MRSPTTTVPHVLDGNIELLASATAVDTVQCSRRVFEGPARRSASASGTGWADAGIGVGWGGCRPRKKGIKERNQSLPVFLGATRSSDALMSAPLACSRP